MERTVDPVGSMTERESGSQRPLRIGIVAGEPSGDLLGARLIRALRSVLPGAIFEGIGGPEMEAEGCQSLYPMERLSVAGLTEVLGRFRELHRLRRNLVRHFIDQQPDVFIGVDYPGFNLGLEERLRRHGIRTVHYVSPQVWAWRTWRVHQIRRAVDRILVMFPFEAPFYARHGIAATYVGHPLADEIPGDRNPRDWRTRLGLDPDRPVVALLPGSRTGELKSLADVFVETAIWLHQRHPKLQFAIPFVNQRTRLLFEAAIERHRAEAMLLRRLMVVTYRVSTISYWLMRAMTHIRLVAMPNNLAGSHLVPELIQHEARPELLGRAVERYLSRPLYARDVLATFERLAGLLRNNAALRAAEAIAEVLRTVPGHSK